ncbi:MAG: DUF1533 domain-containing protein [Ruminococcus sp.]|nr:DUF1533 domain-containing protein [Ruminococcus sp.]
MKKTISIISAAACMAGFAAVPANAEGGDKVYGTMNIPYSDFYSAEIEDAYEVDAVSSATANKWKMNEAGQLVAGTYNDGEGTILGVTFPVEVDASDVDKLAKYGFAALDSKPAAYKEVSLSGDSLTVSKVIDTNGEQNVSGSATVSTSTRYGDYQLNVTGYPEETDLYGVIVNTKEGDKYALRHLENIWRAGQLAWSAGITTKEAHGNELKYDDYADSMGKTVTSVTFITLDGYTTVDVGEQYLPVKFAGEVKAEDSAAGTGKTSLTLSSFPDDYQKNISVGDGFTVTETEISYTNAMPGKYTVTVTDESGKYAPMSGDFILSTSDIPVKYSDGKLVRADGFSDEDAANFIKNIASVEVNGTAYNASGKRSVKIVGEDGTIDFAVKSGENDVFDGSGNYSLTVTAAGYSDPLKIEIKNEEAVTSTTSTATATSPASTTTAASSKAAATSKGADSPKTGTAGTTAPMTVLALACAAAFALRKKDN